MLDGAAGVLVAVSGGPDSVVLLDMLAHLIPVPHLHVAHLDHMLRGLESAEDADFVRGLADQLSLQITIKSVDVGAAAEACGRGIEEIAREIRYDFLLAAAREAGCDRIAVGHTMTDQAETLLMRLIRGAGLRGLAAMRPVIPAHSFGDAREQKAEGTRQKAKDGTQKAGDSGLPSAFCLPPSAFCVLPSVLLIRPLLCISREEVEAYCNDRGLEFHTDSTNQRLHYTRNRVRNEVLPALRAINPRVVESMARAAENIAGDQDVLDRLALSLLANARLASDAWRNGAGPSKAAYSVAALLEQPAGMRRRMIIEAIKLISLRNRTKRERSGAGEISSTQVAAVDGLLRTNASGSHITLPGGLEAWREFDVLALSAAGISVRESEYEYRISSTQPEAEAGGFTLMLQRGQPFELIKSTTEETRLEALRTGRDWMTVALDDDAVPECLVIRPRRPGEQAQVIGQRKTKKLKNLMIDHRIPTSRRANWPLVTTLDGCYVWSPGLPPALKFAAHDKTRRVATMRASAI